MAETQSSIRVGWGSWLLFFGLLLPALLLRFPIAAHDVEHYVGPDEGEIVENVLEMMKTGDWDHRHRGYPGLNFYLLRGAFALRIGLARAFGEPSTIPNMDREGFYLLARRLSVFASWLAAFVACVLAARYGSPFATYFAGLLVAYSPLVFRESQVTNPDLTLILFVGLALVAMIRAGEVPTFARWAIAGIACAGAMAIKYTGAVVLLPAAFALMFSSTHKSGRPSGERLRHVVAFTTALCLGFALVSPYTFLSLDLAARGLGQHLDYYQLVRRNAALELVRQTWLYGLGPVATLLGGLGLPFLLFGLFRATRLKTQLSTFPVFLVALVPLGVLLVFSLFTRAFPRHALILVLPGAVVTSWFWSELARPRSGFRRTAVSLVAVVSLGINLSASFRFARAARIPTAATRAHDWALSTLPSNARILEDQFTPRWRNAFRVRRLQVEEKIFVGDYDWVFFSGYPPGLRTDSLRPVIRFETEGSLGSPVAVFQVPDRVSLMGVTLPLDADEATLGAGELSFFGDGWSAPEPGAFATSRVSTAPAAEVFFVLPATRSDSRAGPIRVAWDSALAVGREPIAYTVFVNGRAAGAFELRGDRPAVDGLRVDGTEFLPGLNRLEWRFEETRRQNRRRRQAAMRLFSVTLRRETKAQ